jgi:hypothetical protein
MGGNLFKLATTTTTACRGNGMVMEIAQMTNLNETAGV